MSDVLHSRLREQMAQALHPACIHSAESGDPIRVEAQCVGCQWAADRALEAIAPLLRVVEDAEGHMRDCSDIGCAGYQTQGGDWLEECPPDGDPGDLCTACVARRCLDEFYSLREPRKEPTLAED